MRLALATACAAVCCVLLMQTVTVSAHSYAAVAGRVLDVVGQHSLGGKAKSELEEQAEYESARAEQSASIKQYAREHLAEIGAAPGTYCFLRRLHHAVRFACADFGCYAVSLVETDEATEVELKVSPKDFVTRTPRLFVLSSSAPLCIAFYFYIAVRYAQALPRPTLRSPKRESFMSLQSRTTDSRSVRPSVVCVRVLRVADCRLSSLPPFQRRCLRSGILKKFRNTRNFLVLNCLVRWYDCFRLWCVALSLSSCCNDRISSNWR
jgi:hypothetical protein